MTDKIYKIHIRDAMIHEYRCAQRAISHTYRADSHAKEIAQDALIYSLLDNYRFGTDIAWALV